MLKVEINKGMRKAAIVGPITDIVADMTLLINTIYLQVKRADPEAAEEFKRLMEKVVLDPRIRTWEDISDEKV